MIRKLKYLFTFFTLFLLGINSAFSATEQVMNSLSGSNIKTWSSGAPSLQVEDQLRSFMLGNPNWGCRFGVKRARVNVLLRYDESKATFFKNWSLNIVYSIKLYDVNGTMVNLTNETAQINYDAGTANYTDKFLKTYENAYRAELTITSVAYNEPGVTGGAVPIPLNRCNDIFLDLQQETERYYNLQYNSGCGTPLTPAVKVTRLTPPSANPPSLPEIQVSLGWDFVEGAESYDVEWFFLDLSGQTSTTINDYINNTPIDFKEAIRINTTQQFYKIPMPYGYGILVFRVRPIGVSHIAPFTDRVEGAWSATTSGNNSWNTVTSANGSHYHTIFTGLDLSYNWQYNATYAEDGKRKEIISYFDGSLRKRQTSTRLNTDGTVVVAETKYDYLGRGTVQLLPTPVAGTGLHYYYGFGGFSKQNFDVDANFPIANATVPAGNLTAAYYGNNPSATGQDALVPNAEGFPYIQTLYKRDGTGRIKAQSNAGPTHRLGSTHETKYFYGRPTGQEELDRLFGNEVGNVSHYQKNLALDANGQVNVSYLDQEGRTIATALSGSPVSQNLLPLDERPTPVGIASDILTGQNNLMGDARVVKTAFLSDAPGKSYTFNYDLNVAMNCQDPCSNKPICAECVYDLEIRITDEDGNLLNGTVQTGNVFYPTQPAPGAVSDCTVTPGKTEVMCTNITGASYSLSLVTPDIGTYYVEKILTISYGQLDMYAELYANEYIGCNKPTLIDPPPCNDCKYLCQQQHRKKDALGNIIYIDAPVNSVPVYTDANGIELPLFPNDPNYLIYDDAGQTIINTCVAACQTISVIPPDDCTLRKLSLTNDMSPGGQYFDNLQNMVPPCASSVSCSNSPVVTSTGINDWLMQVVSNNESVTPSPFWSGFRTFVNNVNSACPVPSLPAVGSLTWNWLRSNWQPCFAKYTMRFHPEYCAYTYFCSDERLLCGSENNPPYVTLQNSKEFDQFFSGGTAAQYYNPASYTNLPNNSFASGVSFPAFTQYISDLGVTPGFSAPASAKDPYLGNYNCPAACATGTYHPGELMSGYLSTYITAFDCPSCYSGSTVITTTCTGCATFQMSIWYLLDDPHNIAQNGENALAMAFPSSPAMAGLKLDPNTVSMFRQYHGYAGNPGMIAQSGKFNIFKNAYAGFKDLIFKSGINAYDCQPFVNGIQPFQYIQPDPQEPTAANCCNSLPHALIRYPQDPIYAAILSSCPPNLNNLLTAGVLPVNTTGPSASDCQITCDAYADGWMNEIVAQAQLCNPSVVLSQAHYNQMRSLLVSVCAANCNATSPQGASSGTTQVSPGIDSFEDVYNYFFNNSGFFPQYYCGSVISNIHIVHPPPAFSQANCSCTNLRSLATDNGISWSSSSAAANLYAVLINTLGISPSTVTQTNVSAWINTCNNTSPDIVVLVNNNFPEVLLCAGEGGVTPNPCEQAEQDAIYQNNLLIAQALEQAKTTYRNLYKSKCLDLGNESLYATYFLDEFAYTLYYYDQAGNLIKTVPPRGVKPLKVSGANGTLNNYTTKDVADYRQGLSTTFIWPNDSLYSNYRHNSLNSVRRQYTPDGGITTSFYDVLGRKTASQDANQSAISPGRYTYTLYDDLSRTIEVGEFTNTTQLTDDIARGQAPGMPLSSWQAASTGKHQITRTWYDQTPPTASLTQNAYSLYLMNLAGNLRNRVACVSYVDEPSLITTPYDHALHYSYDMHGNVKTLLQEKPSLLSLGYDVIRTDYEYDLISGKVNALHHNPGRLDEFHHLYYYDADNRVVAAYSSRDNVIWEKEAKYYYYKHGPLSRSEIGDKQVQGNDYAYTLLGWIKGVNSNMAINSYDIGKDAVLSSANLNRFVGMDAYGYTLGYFGGDYLSKNPSASSFIASTASISALITSTSTAAPLYNGNISHMATTIKNPTSYVTMPQLRGFLYDQKNRIRNSNSITTMSGNAWTGSSYSTQHAEEFHYDLNGNIKLLNRNAISPVAMDRFTYFYPATNNRLNYVADAVSPIAYPDDIDNQSGGNYKYDNIGNLTSDAQQNISTISWNIYGKIKTITKPVANQSDLEFKYDAMGNRVEKIVKPRNASGVLLAPSAFITTHYVRDVQGNVLATYETGNNLTGISLKEQHIYGAARLGTRNIATVYRIDANAAIIEQSTFNNTLGSWVATGGGTATLNNASLLRITGVSAGGGAEKTITTVAKASYCVAFNANTTTAPANTNMMLQVVDVSSGIVLNSSRAMVTCLNTLYFTAATANTKLRFINSGASSGSAFVEIDNLYVTEMNKTRVLGQKQYELSNHLGNVLTTVSDRKIQEIGNDGNANGVVDYYSPRIISATDYYAFGSPMPGRNFSSSSYRFGFNGKENDREIMTPGQGMQDYGFRIYNSSIGKFLSVDPLFKNYPWNSPYTFAENDVISCIDLEGLEKYRVVGRSFAPAGSFEGTIFHAEADNRTSFSSADYKQVSARIHTMVSFDLDAWSTSKQIYSQYSVMEDGTKKPITTQSILAKGYGNKPQKELNLEVEWSARNGANVGPSIDIQYAYKFNRASKNLLKIDGKLTGNMFPAVELVLFDQKGTGISLGTDMAIGTPYSGVWFEQRDYVRFNTGIDVFTDDDGNFLGVEVFYKEKDSDILISETMSPAAYNRLINKGKVWDRQGKSKIFLEKEAKEFTGK